RVARVAALFTEEDLARFLQIMLRTHSDLGYKNEQRFHLELGLLKLVHAQRLLPLEELLSGAATTPTTSAVANPRTVPAPSRPSGPAPSSRPSPFETSRAAAPPRPSPFEADRSRKTEPKAEASTEVAHPPAPAIYAAAQPARGYEPQSAPAPVATATVGSAVAVAEIAPPPPASSADVNIPAIRDAVLNELESAGQNVLVHTLETGVWNATAGEISVKVALSPTMIELSMGPEVKKIVTAAVNRVAGRPMKFILVGGADPASLAKPAPRAAVGPSARSRAMN